MFLIDNLKYNFSDIHKYIEEWNEEEYVQLSKKLTRLYNDIKGELVENEEELQEEFYPERDIDWSELNGYETRFGKKYLGYLRREHENSRFGSYPLHDDYSEESDTEGFTNLDY